MMNGGRQQMDEAEQAREQELQQRVDALEKGVDQLEQALAAEADLSERCGASQGEVQLARANDLKQWLIRGERLDPGQLIGCVTASAEGAISADRHP